MSTELNRSSRVLEETTGANEIIKRGPQIYGATEEKGKGRKSLGDFCWLQQIPHSRKRNFESCYTWGVIEDFRTGFNLINGLG